MSQTAIAPVTPSTTPEASKPTLEALKAKFGGVPKMFATWST